jgi:autotransporter-associated beta strand protein
MSLIGSRARMVRSVKAAAAAVSVGMVAFASPLRADVFVWDGGGVGGTELGTAAHWNPDGLPGANVGDVLRWDGTAGGDLTLTNDLSANLNLTGSAGVSIDVTGAQTAALTIDGSQPLRLNGAGISIATGAGAFRLGGPAGSFPLVVANGSLAFTNNSASTATLGANLAVSSASAAATTYAFGGTGNWAVNGNLNSSSFAGNGLTKDGAGTLTLNGTSTFTGAVALRGGTLTYAGASANAGNNLLSVGNAAGARATLNVATTGTVAFGAALEAPIGGAGAGALNVSSGTLNFTGAANNYLSVGSTGGYGALNLAGGAINTVGASGIRVGGGGGLGSYVQAGGTLNLQRFFAVSANTGAGGAGVATFTGGSVTTDPTRGILVGDNANANAVVNLGTLAGGTAIINSAATGGLQVANGNTSSGSATLNLNAGTLRLGGRGIFRASTNAAATATVNLNGAVLQPTSANITLIENTNGLSANVARGGVTFDTSANNATVTAALLDLPGNGVYTPTISVPAGGAGYIGAPIVTVTGGGTGATAVANVSGGVVTGVTLTSPGQNYVAGQTLTFTFAGGGATAPATTLNYVLTAADLADNTGGLAKAGTAALILTANNTYTGATDVNAGTLRLTGVGAIAASPTVTVKPGATLDVAGVTGGANHDGTRFALAGGQTLRGGGTVAGTLGVRGGATVSPGEGVGTLNTAAVAFTAADAVLAADIDAQALVADLLNVTGSVSVADSTLALSIANDASLGASATFILVANDGSDLTTGTFLTVTGVPAGYTATVDPNYAGIDALGRIGTGNDVAVTLTVVPEPASLTLLAGGAALLRRRRSR